MREQEQMRGGLESSLGDSTYGGGRGRGPMPGAAEFQQFGPPPEAGGDYRPRGPTQDPRQFGPPPAPPAFEPRGSMPMPGNLPRGSRPGGRRPGPGRGVLYVPQEAPRISSSATTTGPWTTRTYA